MKDKSSIIAITETWLSEGEDILFSIDGYKFISMPRESVRGGGVEMYVSNKIEFKIRTELARY